MVSRLALAALLALAPGARDDEAAEPLRLELAGGRHSVLVPRDETLIFEVRLQLGLLGAPEVGKVTMRTEVQPYATSPLLLAEPGSGSGTGGAGDVIVLTGQAEGEYQFYELHDETTTRILPQEWPTILHRRVQTGSENRRKEMMLGWMDGAFTAKYRKDRHCKGCSAREHYLKPGWIWEKEHHCRKCRRAEHRVWRDYYSKEVPEQAVDMMTAIQLARTMVADGEDSLEIVLIDKLDLWDVTLTRGETRLQKVQAGVFEAVEVRMATRPPPGEEGRDEDFEGLFGIKGSISMWFDAASGVPVLIAGEVPVGMIDLSVRVELKYYSGTPPGFRG